MKDTATQNSSRVQVRRPASRDVAARLFPQCSRKGTGARLRFWQRIEKPGGFERGKSHSAACPRPPLPSARSTAHWLASSLRLEASRAPGGPKTEMRPRNCRPGLINGPTACKRETCRSSLGIHRALVAAAKNINTAASGPDPNVAAGHHVR